MRCLFVLSVGYLFIRTFSFLLLLHTVSWRYDRDYLYVSIDILFCITFYITNAPGIISFYFPSFAFSYYFKMVLNKLINQFFVMSFDKFEYQMIKLKTIKRNEYP